MYLVAVVAAFLISLPVGRTAVSNRQERGARPLAGIAAAAAIWAGGSAALVLVSSPSAEHLWHRISYIGMVGAPIAFATFALEYTGHRQYLTRGTVGGLLALGGLFLGLVWTNSWHGLYWSAVDTSAATPIGLATSPAPAFFAFVAFTYLLLSFGSLLLVRHALALPGLYRYQSAAILVSVFVPWLANIPHVLQFMAADYTPVALAVTALALWLAMFRFDLTSITPVALRSVFETIETAVVVVDRRDRVVEINAAGKQLLYGDALLGTHIRERVPDTALYDRFESARNDQGIVPVETDSGDPLEHRYYDVRVSPIAPAGRTVGRLFVIDDVTSQQRQQRELQTQRDRLEEFAAVVSHDLRNPLNVASGHVALAQQECDSERLDDAGHALDRMETLIDDLLELAREGNAVTNPEPVSLPTLVSESWDAVDTKDATFVNSAEGTITADRSRLQQLVENLFRNAVEHGGRDVTVTVGSLAGGFYVADDGPGIPPAARDSVFDDGYSTSDDGTGLGLSIVERIADAHGWDITLAESADGGLRLELTSVEVADRPPL